MRFIAYKKQINAGGVIPDIPDDKTLELLAGHKQWGEHEEVKLKLLLSQNILEDNFDYGSDESQISASLLDDHDSGSDLETDTNVSDAENRNLANDSHTQSLKEEAKFENLDQLNKDKSSSKPGPSTLKTTKKRTCGVCPPCKIKDDCGSCKFCKDKRRFGGMSKLRKKCALRQCTNLTKDIVKMSTKNGAK